MHGPLNVKLVINHSSIIIIIIIIILSPQTLSKQCCFKTVCCVIWCPVLLQEVQTFSYETSDEHLSEYRYVKFCF